MEPEITEHVRECTDDARLRPEAIGWSRHPLHECNLKGRWGRKKRWDYWCVTTDHHLLSLTYADCDYLGLVSVLFLDYATNRCVEKGIVVPFALGFRQPDTFVPFFEKPMRVNLLLAGAEVHACFGHFDGAVKPHGRPPIAVRRLMGWAEEMRARW